MMSVTCIRHGCPVVVKYDNHLLTTFTICPECEKEEDEQIDDMYALLCGGQDMVATPCMSPYAEYAKQNDGDIEEE